MPNVEITGELIKSAVANQIIKEIPTAAGRVYKEPQNQNINGDAFYIVQRRVNQDWQTKSMLKRDYEMVIRYEPDIRSQTQLENCALMGNLLIFALKSIDSGGGVLIHGSNMSFETTDNVSLTYVTYTIRIKVEPDSFNPMQDLAIIKEVIE